MLTCAIAGVGAWGPGFCDWSELSRLLAAPPATLPNTTTPRPEIIPARERRRAPPSVQLAVTVAMQACNHANVLPAECACVFASGMGDTAIADYLCRILATENKAISPTKFHNSVHNAAAGYWTISTHCQQPANAVSAVDDSVAVSLLEAVVQCVDERRPVLLVCQDTVTSAPMMDIREIRQNCALAMLLMPQIDRPSKLSLELAPGPGQCPAMTAASLQDLFQGNPSAHMLTLLHTLAAGGGSIEMPLSPGSHLLLKVSSEA